MKNILILLLATIGVSGMSSGYVSADTTIVEQGRSTFTIVIPAKAPTSVKDAAWEFRNNVYEATGVAIPIENDSEQVEGPYISLGATEQASIAKITTGDIPDEGFRILTREGNLYILGPDTAALIVNKKDPWGWQSDLRGRIFQPDIPGRQLTEEGGFSHGTANGVYTFLEDYLGVRWLMPGDIGKVIPRKSTFSIPKLDRIESPAFIQREIDHLYPSRQRTNDIDQWALHQKLGQSIRLNVAHNWQRAVPARWYDRHPDWFAMDRKGKRPKPTGRYKLETTNQSMVKYYARRVVSHLQSNPYDYTYSLSATDSRGYSQSPESKALQEPSPTGSIHPSVTPMILKFYRDVAKIVAKEYPQGMLAGYIYQDFKYPPRKGSAIIPKNIIPVLAGNGYGYGYYREDRREQQAAWMHEWVTRSDNKNWLYYGIPNNLKDSNGIIMPPAPDILNFIFGILKDNEFKGAKIYGGPNWSQEAISNYITAKMMWNPSLDAHALQEEWLKLAYGKEAGAVIEELYNEMDHGGFAEYKKQNPGYKSVTEKMFEEYYAPHYKKIERFILKAQNQPMTKKQRVRLQLLANNVIVLQWRLKNAGYLPFEFKSPLTRDNEEVIQLLQSSIEDSFQHFPGVVYEKLYNRVSTGIKPTKIKLSHTPMKEKKATSMPNSKFVILYSLKNRDIELNFSDIQLGSSFLNYHLTDAATGVDVQAGVLYSGKRILFRAKADTAYYLQVNPNGVNGPRVKWQLNIPDASLAKATYEDGTVYLHGRDSQIYIYKPVNYEVTKRVPQEAKQDEEGVTFYTSLTEEEKIQEKFPGARTVKRLDGKWKFRTDPEKTGDKHGYVESRFDDSQWKEIEITKQWQFQGFPDFHGTAWYRKTFTSEAVDADDDPDQTEGRMLYFEAVDGDATIYLNGREVGEHLLKNNGDGWDEAFSINVTDAIEEGQNTVVVKVTKDRTDVPSGIWKKISLKSFKR